MEINLELKGLKIGKQEKYLIFILAVGFLLRILFIDTTALNWDESAYSFRALQNTKDFLAFFKLGYQDPYWLSYPPLHSYVTALFISILGFTELAVRMPSIVSGFLTIFLTYLIGKEIFNKRVALIASAAMAVNPFAIIVSRLAYIDMLLTFFTTLALLFFVKFLKQKKTKHLLLTYAVMALAIMTKYNAAYFAMIFILYALLFERKIFFQKRSYAAAIVFFLMISPLLIVGFQTNFEFLSNQYKNAGILRALLPFPVCLIPEFGYCYEFPPIVAELVDMLWLFSPALFLFSLVGMQKALKKKEGLSYLLLMLSALLLIFHSTMSMFHWYYLIYIVPMLSVFVGLSMEKMKKRYISAVMITGILLSALIISQMSYRLPEEVGKYIRSKEPILVASQQQTVVGFYSGLPVMWFNPSADKNTLTLINSGLLEYIVERNSTLEGAEEEIANEKFVLDKVFVYEPDLSNSWYVYKNKINLTAPEKVIMQCLYNFGSLDVNNCPQINQLGEEGLNKTLSSLIERNILSVGA